VTAFGPVATDFESEGLLDGLEGDAREARLDLLRRLEESGVSLEELKQASAEGRLVLLPVELALEGEGPRYTSAEVAESSGLDEEFHSAMLRALGLARPAPDERVFTDEDVAAARRLRQAREAGIPDDQLLEITRAMGRGMSSLAATVTRIVGRAMLRPGDTERDLALRYAGASRELTPLLGEALPNVLSLHLREQLRHVALEDSVLEQGALPEAEQIAVCFADLVGFTKLGERIPTEDLGEVADRLGELATDVASPPVRLVKTIGDAAMLVSPDVDALLDSALALVDAGEAEDYPQLRAGVAQGEAIGRGGDFYGAPVNLASRLTSHARPGSVLAEASVREAANGDWSWSFAGKQRFRGLRKEVPVFRVRRGEAEAD
jgi:adenylate cyclase